MEGQREKNKIPDDTPHSEDLELLAEMSLYGCVNPRLSLPFLGSYL